MHDHCGTADHDMIYLEPFKGRKEIRKYFSKVVSIVPADLQFVVEDITHGDPHKVGVKWCATSHDMPLWTVWSGRHTPTVLMQSVSRQACGG